VQIDDTDNSRFVEDVHISFEVTNDVIINELEKCSTPALMISMFTRRVLVTFMIH